MHRYKPKISIPQSLINHFAANTPLEKLIEEFPGLNASDAPSVLEQAVIFGDVTLVTHLLMRSNVDLTRRKMNELILAVENNGNHRLEIENFLKDILNHVKKFEQLLYSNTSLTKIMAFLETDEYFLSESYEYLVYILQNKNLEFIKAFFDNENVQSRFRATQHDFFTYIVENSKHANEIFSYLIDIGIFSNAIYGSLLHDIILHRSISLEVVKKFINVTKLTTINVIHLKEVIKNRDLEAFLYFFNKIDPEINIKTIQMLMKLAKSRNKNEIINYLKTLINARISLATRLCNPTFTLKDIQVTLDQNHLFLAHDLLILNNVLAHRDLQTVIFFLKRINAIHTQKIKPPSHLTKIGSQQLAFAVKNEEYANEIVHFLISEKIIEAGRYSDVREEQLLSLIKSPYISLATIKHFVNTFKLNFKLQQSFLIVTAAQTRNKETVEYLLTNSFHITDQKILSDLIEVSLTNKENSREISRYIIDLMTNLSKLTDLLNTKDASLPEIERLVVDKKIPLRLNFHFSLIILENYNLPIIKFFLEEIQNQIRSKKISVHALHYILKNILSANDIINYLIDNDLLDTFESKNTFTTYLINMIVSKHITNATVIKFASAYKLKFIVDIALILNVIEKRDPEMVAHFISFFRPDLSYSFDALRTAAKANTSHSQAMTTLIDNEDNDSNALIWLLENKTTTLAAIKKYFFPRELPNTLSRALESALACRGRQTLHFLLTHGGKRHSATATITCRHLIEAAKNVVYGNRLLNYIFTRKLLRKDEAAEDYIKVLYVLICFTHNTFDNIKKFVFICEEIFNHAKSRFQLLDEINLLEKIVELRDLDTFRFFLPKITMRAMDRAQNVIFYASLNRKHHLDLLEFIYESGLSSQCMDGTMPIHVAALLGLDNWFPVEKDLLLTKNNKNQGVAFYAGLGNQSHLLLYLLNLPELSGDEKNELSNDYQNGLSFYNQAFQPETRTTATQSSFRMFSKSTDTEIDEATAVDAFEDDQDTSLKLSE